MIEACVGGRLRRRPGDAPAPTHVVLRDDDARKEDALGLRAGDRITLELGSAVDGRRTGFSHLPHFSNWAVKEAGLIRSTVDPCLYYSNSKRHGSTVDRVDTINCGPVPMLLQAGPGCDRWLCSPQGPRKRPVPTTAQPTLAHVGDAPTAPTPRRPPPPIPDRIRQAQITPTAARRS